MLYVAYCSIGEVKVMTIPTALSAKSPNAPFLTINPHAHTPTTARHTIPPPDITSDRGLYKRTVMDLTDS